jgi:hypothetical protein
MLGPIRWRSSQKIHQKSRKLWRSVIKVEKLHMFHYFVNNFLVELFGNFFNRFKLCTKFSDLQLPYWFLYIYLF